MWGGHEHAGLRHAPKRPSRRDVLGQRCNPSAGLQPCTRGARAAIRRQPIRHGEQREHRSTLRLCLMVWRTVPDIGRIFRNLDCTSQCSPRQHDSAAEISKRMAEGWCKRVAAALVRGSGRRGPGGRPSPRRRSRPVASGWVGGWVSANTAVGAGLEQPAPNNHGPERRAFTEVAGGGLP